MTGDRLRQLREHLNLNQQEFSRETGIGQGNLSQIEKGERAFGKRTQKIILVRYNVNETWWTTGKGEILLDKGGKIPVYLWSDLSGFIQDHCRMRFLSDCDIMTEYHGPDFEHLKKGMVVALRSTLIPRVAIDTLLVISHREGTFAGKLVSVQKETILLKDEKNQTFSLEKRLIDVAYRIVGGIFRI